MTGFASMPAELLAEICTYLPNPDLKNFRLVSKDCDPPAVKSLFRDITVSFIDHEIEKIRCIADHPIIGKQVRAVTVWLDYAPFLARFGEGYEAPSYLQVFGSISTGCLASRHPGQLRSIATCIGFDEHGNPTDDAKNLRRYIDANDVYQEIIEAQYLRQWVNFDFEQDQLYQANGIGVLCALLCKLELWNSPRLDYLSRH